MGIIPLEDIQPGMILASDLRTSQGRLLLPKQSAIETKHLRMALIWGITEADIEGMDSDRVVRNPLDMVDPDQRDLLEEILIWRFGHCDTTAAPVRRLMELFMQKVAVQAKGVDPHKLREYYIGPPVSASKAAKQLGQVCNPKVSCEKMLRREPALACLPDIFHEIVEAVKSPKTSAMSIAEIIGKDPGLASKLLRLVNSAFYGFESRVDTLDRAVAIVGTEQIANLAMGMSVISVFKGIPPDFVDMHSFWEHSLAVGVISRLLGVHRKISLRERLFVAGLLHDLGKLVIYKNYLEQAETLMARARDSSKPLIELEKEAWGFTHAELGQILLETWRIPESIKNTVALHHTPLHPKATDEAKLVHLADVIAFSLCFGHTGLRRVPPLCLKTWDQIGLPVNSLSAIAAQAENQLRDLMRVFLVD